MRNGFTTGSCAAAAAKAAAYMLLSGHEKDNISIITPAGVEYHTSVLDITRGDDGGYVSCAVRKDGGDDPDITTGALVYAKVSFDSEAPADVEGSASPMNNPVLITGGEGIGRVTRPGLERPVGDWAINNVPREMIIREVMETAELFEYRGGFAVEISVPGGRKLAEKTFNPNLGIEGGISILGTTGIVEPMSTDAVIKTIRAQLSVKKAMGASSLIFVFGNYGVDFLKKNYGIDRDDCVIISNFIGSAVDIAKELGFEKILVCGHAGKLVKTAGGIMNTHSREADGRMEIIAAAAAEAGAEGRLIRGILASNTTEEAFDLLFENGLGSGVSGRLVEKIIYHLKRRAGSDIEIDCILYTGRHGLLASTLDSDSTDAGNEVSDNSLHFVGAGPGAEDLITVRGSRLLEQADLIIYTGSLVNPKVLKYARQDCEILNSAYMTLEEVLGAMSDAVKAKKTVVRLHTGEPSIYGAVREQMDGLDEMGIAYDSTPGVSACFGAAAALDLEYTLPRVSQSLIITRMSGRTKVPEAESIESFASHKASMAVYLSAGMMRGLAERLINGGYPPDTPAAIVYKATWPDEKSIICTVEELPDQAEKYGITKTAVVLVGSAVAQSGYEKSKLYDKNFSTEYRNAD